MLSGQVPANKMFIKAGSFSSKLFWFSTAVCRTVFNGFSADFTPICSLFLMTSSLTLDYTLVSLLVMTSSLTLGYKLVSLLVMTSLVTLGYTLVSLFVMTSSLTLGC